MNSKVNIAIFASGEGTNAEAIAHYAQSEAPHLHNSGLLTNRADAGAIPRMQRLGISTLHFPNSEWRSGGEHVIEWLRQEHIDLIVLAGFLAYVPQAIVHEWEGRIVNSHPALLPRYGGKGMYGHHVHEAVLAAGDTVTGTTFHLVDEEFDHGRILAQFECPVYPTDTPSTLQSRVKSLEHLHYPPLISSLALTL
ncbi:MAG: phosphoribosylglycinamide formyltransferase [Bacteroidales bacterium]|nr:phosphoribosylglycinamide formyltransferase [Bacteroidales bacterium]